MPGSRWSWRPAGGCAKSLDAELDRLISDPRFDAVRRESSAPSGWRLDKFTPSSNRIASVSRKLTRDARTQLRREPVQFLRHLFRENLSCAEPDRLRVRRRQRGGRQLLRPRRPDRERFRVCRDSAMAGATSAVCWLSRRSSPGSPTGERRTRSSARPGSPGGSWPSPRTTRRRTCRPSRKTRSSRSGERLEQHRNQTGCVQCRTKIDPWGLPFEEFDAGGRRRPARSTPVRRCPTGAKVAGVRRPAAAPGRCPARSGRVQPPQAPRDVRQRPDAVLRRARPRLKREAESDLRARGYRLRDLLRYVVHSPMFLEK